MMPYTDSKICPNQTGGKVVVRCRGCGSHHSTKNIGWRDEKTNVVSPARSIFDILDEICTCNDPAEHPLVHNCALDDNWKPERR